jgi:hypothetical protein
MIKNMINFFSIFLILTSFNYIKSSLKFNIPSYRDKCFQIEVYIEGTLLIRYDLTGFENYFKGEEQQELFNNIKVFVKNAKDQNIYETSLKSRKDKFAILLKEPQIYKICARYFKPKRGRELPGFVMMGLKIRNDYQYTDIDNSLHKDDVKDFWKKIREIKKDLKPSIEAAKLEINEEDKTAKSMISSINIYYKLCCIQLVIIIIVTVYTVVTYQDFLKKKSLI